MSTDPTTDPTASPSTVIDLVTQGLGVMVWWDLENTRITPAKLRDVLQTEQWDASIVVDIPPVKAARDAARGLSGGFRARVTKEDAGVLHIGIQGEKRKDATTVDSPQIGLVTYTEATDKIEVTLDDDTDLELVAATKRLIKSIRDRQRNYDHNFIRPNIIQASMTAWGAFNLRKKGGICYVPRQHQDECEALARIVGRIGDSSLHIAHVSDTDASRRSIGGEASNHLGTTLADVTERLTDWKKKNRSVRADALASAMEELRTLKAHAELYADALNLGLDDLYVEIEEAVGVANELLGLRSESNGKKKPSPKIQALIEATRKAHGDTVTAAELETSGWPASAWKHVTYWSSNARATLTAMGLRARLKGVGTDDAAVTFMVVGAHPIITNAQGHQSQRIDTPPVEKPPVEKPTLVAVMAVAKATSITALYERFTAATGDAPKKVSSKYKKIDLAEAVMVAEASAA